MRKLLVWTLALGMGLACWAGRAEAKQWGPKKSKVTVTGTLVDVACYLDDGATGNDHMGMKNCGTKCLESGSPAGLLDGKKLYILAFPAGTFADYVGKKVEIAGTLYGTSSLIPHKAEEVEADGHKKDINLKGKSMM